MSITSAARKTFFQLKAESEKPSQRGERRCGITNFLHGARWRRGWRYRAHRFLRRRTGAIVTWGAIDAPSTLSTAISGTTAATGVSSATLRVAPREGRVYFTSLIRIFRN